MTKRMFALVAGGVVLVSLLYLPVFCDAQRANDQVERAYQSKMSGKADSARVILEQVLAADSTNAAAWFELARVRYQIGLGNPLKLLREIAILQRTAVKAAAIDPDNVIYAYYKAYVCFFRANGSLMLGRPDAATRIDETIAAYEAVLALDPDFHEARLYLVEALLAPEDLGGDIDKVVANVEELERRDPITGAMARDLILPDDADHVEFWKTKLAENPGNPVVMEQLGRAYLNQDRAELGIRQLEAALKADPDKQLLLLEVARYYLTAFRQDASQGDVVLPLAKEAINRYLRAELNRPLRAYALYALSGIERDLGSTEAAEALLLEAREQDPHVSKAFEIPPGILFTKPDEVSHFHAYFSRPF